MARKLRKPEGQLTLAFLWGDAAEDYTESHDTTIGHDVPLLQHERGVLSLVPAGDTEDVIEAGTDSTVQPVGTDPHLTDPADRSVDSQSITSVFGGLPDTGRGEDEHSQPSEGDSDSGSAADASGLGRQREDGLDVLPRTQADTVSSDPVEWLGDLGRDREVHSLGNYPRFRPETIDEFGTGGTTNRIRANIAALRRLKELENTGETPTEKDLSVLARWSGWGTIAQVFDSNGSFTEERSELEELLTSEELFAARLATPNAHYTDPVIVQAMWKFLGDLGLSSGRVLEPGCGSGHFVGYAPEGVDMVGVELDPTTARIAQVLYPDAEIRSESFADSTFVASDFDAAIGNVPFGDYALFDPTDNTDNFNIHNHFILKSLRLTRPGGVVAVVTSRYTMDSKNPGARRRFEEVADFIGAVRLPEIAHQRTALTSVVTDVLFFRRREAEVEPSGIPFITTRPYDVENAISINEYFLDNPGQVLGDFSVSTGMYSAQTLHVTLDVPQASTLQQKCSLMGEQLNLRLGEMAEALLSEDMGFAPRKAEYAAPLPVARVGRNPSRLEGFISYDQAADTFYCVESGRTRPYLPSSTERTKDPETGKVRTVTQRNDFPKTDAEELRALIAMRDVGLDLLTLESQNASSTPQMIETRALLNSMYDTYVVNYGALNRYSLIEKTTTKSVDVSDDAELEELEDLSSKAYRKVIPSLGGFRTDPFWYFVASFELFDDNTLTAAKGPIFSNRIVNAHIEPTGADTASDALQISMTYRGRIDLEYMADLCGNEVSDIIQELGDEIFEDPRSPGDYVLAADYLSGNVVAKLAVAEELVATEPRFERNVRALTEVKPIPLRADEIGMVLGSPWIPAEMVTAFGTSILQSDSIRVLYVGDATWSVEGGTYGPTATYSHGTLERPFGSLLESILNHRPIRVYKTIDERQVMDPDATLAAQEKAELIQNAFSEWCLTSEYTDQVVSEYNRLFNNTVLRNFDSHPAHPVGVARTFTPRHHQLVGVARMLTQPTVLLAHEVGAGKTATMIMGTMELKRLGMISKPAYVVPNHMVDSFAIEFLRLYPSAQLLVGRKEDYQGADGKRRFIAKASASELDAVILGHSMFKAIPLSDKTREQYTDEAIREYRQQLDDLEAVGAIKTKMIAKKIQSRINKLTAERTRLAANQLPGITFEMMGIDYLCVDESHVYKNLETVTDIPDAAISPKLLTADMFQKMLYLRRLNNNQHYATFATATPIANSITECHALLRYLAPELLAERDITAFNNWASTFAKHVPILELSPDCTTYRIKTRFAEFINIPELVQMLHTFTDLKLAADLDLPIPKLEGDKPQTIAVPAAPELRGYIQQLGDRAEAIRSGLVDPSEDNMLVVSTDGRKASLDLRLVGLDAPESEYSKLAIATETISRIYHENKDNIYLDATGSQSEIPGALQIVFSDISTPNGDNRWTAYESLRDSLVAAGVPRGMIRFVQDADTDLKKATLFAECRSGKVAVLMGSTSKMGVGTNVQDRAIALHSLDCPWRPADVRQREGRILRQGNQNPTVQIYRYVTEGSFDIYSWQTVERKAAFINSIMGVKSLSRSIEDTTNEALSYAEVKAIATGNPLVLEQAQITTALTKLERSASSFHKSRSRTEAKLLDLRKESAYLQKTIPELEELCSHMYDTSGLHFAMDVISNKSMLRTKTSPLADEVPNRDLYVYSTYTDRDKAALTLYTLLKGLQDGHYGRQFWGEVARIGGVSIDMDVETSYHASWKLRISGTTISTAIDHDRQLNYRRALEDTTGRYSTPVGLIRSIESLVGSVPSEIATMQSKLARNDLDAAALSEQLATPFPQQAQLDDLRRRKAEIDAELSGELLGTVDELDRTVVNTVTESESEQVS